MTMVILKDVDYEDLEALVYYMYKVWNLSG